MNLVPPLRTARIRPKWVRNSSISSRSGASMRGKANSAALIATMVSSLGWCLELVGQAFLVAECHAADAVAVGARREADRGARRGHLDHLVGEAADTGHLDVDRIARFERARVGGRAGQQDVTGQEGHMACQVGDQVAAVEDLLADRAFLD